MSCFDFSCTCSIPFLFEKSQLILVPLSINNTCRERFEDHVLLELNQQQANES